MNMPLRFVIKCSTAVISRLKRLYCLWSNFITLRVSSVKFDEPPSINGRIIINNRGQLKFGRKLKINSSSGSDPIGCESRTLFVVNSSGNISIGNNVGISNSTFVSRQSIVVEDDVLIGGGCMFWDNDFHSLDINERYSAE